MITCTRIPVFRKCIFSCSLFVFRRWTPHGPRSLKTESHNCANFFVSCDGNGCWPKVGPTSVLLCRRWANVGPTSPALWVVIWWIDARQAISHCLGRWWHSSLALIRVTRLESVNKILLGCAIIHQWFLLSLVLVMGFLPFGSYLTQRRFIVNLTHGNKHLNEKQYVLSKELIKMPPVMSRHVLEATVCLCWNGLLKCWNLLFSSPFLKTSACWKRQWSPALRK